MAEIETIFDRILADRNETDRKPATPDHLRALRKSFTTHHVFTPGQVVQWKPNMDSKTPRGPFIVMEVLPAPVPAAEKTASIYYNERLDIRVGYTEHDGTFSELLLDSRRLEPFTETPDKEV